MGGGGGGGDPRPSISIPGYLDHAILCNNGMHAAICNISAIEITLCSHTVCSPVNTKYH